MENKVFCSQWLSDGIGDDYKQWHRRKDANHPLHSATRAYIESPTGTGKTSFVVDKLLPYAAQHNRNILYLGNRSALKEQTQNAIKAKLIEVSNSTTNALTDRDTILDDVKTFQYPGSNTTITTLNYQAVLGALKHSPISTPFYYVIFDEAHFFFEDALFNAKTYLIFERIMQICYDSVLIFMSATLEEVTPVFRDALEYFRPDHPERQIRDHLYSEIEIFYRNTISQKNYQPLFYFEDDTLLRQIKISPKKEKWLIFVSSKQVGRNLMKNIQEETNRTVRLLNADKKGNAGWNLLVKESRFEENILISTSVLDNGANIKDPSVKHIVLPFCNRVEYLQMMGRRRICGNEQITIYSKVPSIQSLNSQLRQALQMADAIENVVQARGRDAKTRVLQDYWMKNDPALNSLFYIDHKRSLVPNPFALGKINHLIDFYEYLIANSKNPLYYQQVVLTWLQLPSDEPQHLSMTNAPTLSDFLHFFEGQGIPETQIEDFYQEFQLLYKIHCLGVFGNGTVELSHALGIRKGKSQRKSTINKELALLNFPYQIVKKQRFWVLQKL